MKDSKSHTELIISLSNKIDPKEIAISIEYMSLRMTACLFLDIALVRKWIKVIENLSIEKRILAAFLSCSGDLLPPGKTEVISELNKSRYLRSLILENTNLKLFSSRELSDIFREAMDPLEIVEMLRQLKLKHPRKEVWPEELLITAKKAVLSKSVTHTRAEGTIRSYPTILNYLRAEDLKTPRDRTILINSICLRSSLQNILSDSRVFIDPKVAESVQRECLIEALDTGNQKRIYKLLSVLDQSVSIINFGKNSH